MQTASAATCRSDCLGDEHSLCDAGLQRQDSPSGDEPAKISRCPKEILPERKRGVVCITSILLLDMGAFMIKVQFI